jgi:Short C-terminal domain
MQELTPEGRRRVVEVRERQGFSAEAAASLVRSLIAGRGSMAQFDHPELGGRGQWVQGGMIMIGDMFNHALKARVEALCAGLAEVVRDEPVGHTKAGAGPSDAWWPEGLGTPGTTGSQNDARYAYFPETRRLVIQSGGRTAVYDTGDHRIGGVAQQRSGSSSLAFTSQHGPVRLESLREVKEGQVSGEAKAASQATATDDVFGKIERLGDLRQKGLISEDEFAAKKAELLKRV